MARGLAVAHAADYTGLTMSDDGSRGTSLISGCMAILIVVGALLLGLAEQTWVYRGEREVLQQRLDDANKRTQQGLIFEQQMPEFRRAVAKLDTDMATIEQILPSALATAPFVEAVRESAKASGIDATLVHERNLPPEERLQSAALAMSFCGDEQTIEQLLDRLRKKARLVLVTPRKMQDGCIAAELRVFAISPADPPSVWNKPCLEPMPTATIWAPFLSSRIEDRRKLLAEVCAEMTRLRPIVEEVLAYQARQVDLEERIKIIDARPHP